jgi:flagellar motor switch protein FliN
MPDEEARQAPTWLAEECAGQLTRVLETMTGQAPAVGYAAHELAPAEIESGEDQFLWWDQSFSLSADTRIWIGAATSSWEEIGNRALLSAGIEGEDRETVQSTYLEILSQTLSGLASVISARARTEVSCVEGRKSAPASASGLLAYSFEIGIGDKAFPVLAAWSRPLAELDEEPASSPAQAPAANQAPQPSELALPNSIDLLLDVELPVSVSFGRAQLALKDVIKLTTGSIVELNRAVTEPVEVIVNNCVIARGEVVVVEGNFGIRIKQVISRQERLRTLN